ncbi:STAS domain-containing protein [Haloferula sargassicola]|uniref:STAS domain-containing protein n=1 Tax=Haloferula sargassicola TaxID=490096 RepID=A0ABP9UQE8_9BACT
MHTESRADTLHVTGVTELTAGSAREVKDQVRLRLTDGLDNIDFDASVLEFLDSSGLGALISMQKLAQERGGKLRLLSPTPPATQVLELTRLHRVFEIVS